MFLYSQEQKQEDSVTNTNANGETQLPLTTEMVRAGTTVLMTHAERQEFWKNSELGQLLGLSD